MVFLRFLARLCASDAEPPAAPSQKTFCQAQSPSDHEVQTVDAPAAHDLALAALHRLLSGLTGTSFQRVIGLLDALKSADVTGATFASLYVVPEGEESDGELSLILVGGTRHPSDCSENEEGNAAAVCLLPDPQQAVLFKRMILERVPVYECLERSAAGVNSASAFDARAQQQLAAEDAGEHASPALSSSLASMTRVAAVPLLHGTKLAGALWLEQDIAATASKSDSLPLTQVTASSSASSPSLVSDPRVLQALGFACSMCMLGAEGSNMAWLAGALARLGGSDTLSALTSQLCVTVAAHVRRRFVLDSDVTAALVPPNQDASLGLLLQPHPQSTVTGVNANGPDATPSGEAVLNCAPPDRARPSLCSASGGSRMTCRSPGGPASGASLLQFAQHHLTQTQQESAASRRKLLRPSAMSTGPWPNGLAGGLIKDLVNESKLRWSLDLSTSRNRAAGAFPTGGLPADIHRTPSVGPVISSRSIVIQLGQENASNAAGSAPGLHAKAFPLQRTLLQAHLQDQQRQQQQQRPENAQRRMTHSSGAVGVADGPSSTAAAAAGAATHNISAASMTAVVEDTQLHVQNVHKPSGDICILMGLRRTATGMSGSCNPTGTGMAAVGVGGAGTPAVPQSLVLLAVQLGEGATLGLYLCFGKRLPAQLLDAVRISCQELLDKSLAAVVRGKLREKAIGPEYETLCCAGPGSYAVVRSPSFCGSQLNPLAPLPPSLCVAYMSTATASDLAVGMGAENVANNTTAPELLSGVLSTTDMDVLLGQPPQAQQGVLDHTTKRSAAVAVAARRNPAAAAAAAAAATAANRKSGAASFARLALSGQTRFIDRRGTSGPTAAVGPAGESVELLNLSQLLQSNANDMLASLGMGMGGAASGQLGPVRTGSFRSLADLEQIGYAASIITVAGVDAAATARQQLDLLVSSIHATINTDPGAGGAMSSRLDDLDALELGEVLGQGGGGTVFMGKLGTLDVAVKLMELPKMDPAAEAATQQQQRKCPAQATTPAVGAAAIAGDAAAATDKLCLNARREMLRNATELAVQSRVSHPNIVQIYATYNDVVMIPKSGAPGCPGSTYQLRPAPLSGPNAFVGESSKACPLADSHHVACVAAAFELCDGGSLGSVLAARTFPRTGYCDGDNAALGGTRIIDMKGVYMTLLDVALALRHLHSFNLVHRDIKPANLLLKSSPRDYRGFTVKLADFGFVLHLSETADDGTRYVMADQACGTMTHMAPEALLAKARIDAAVDIYAFGVLMWEMFSAGVRPFPHLQPDKIPRAVYRGARPTFSDDIPYSFRSLALACWGSDPQRRPKASDVVCMINSLLQELEA